MTLKWIEVGQCGSRRIDAFVQRTPTRATVEYWVIDAPVDAVPARYTVKFLPKQMRRLTLLGSHSINVAKTKV